MIWHHDVALPVEAWVYQSLLSYLTHYLEERPFNIFANRADPDQAALVKAAWLGSIMFAYMEIWLDI